MKKKFFTLEAVEIPNETTGHPLTLFWRFSYNEGRKEIFHEYFKCSRQSLWLVFSDLQTRFQCDGVLKHDTLHIIDAAVPGVLSNMMESPEEFMTFILK